MDLRLDIERRKKYSAKERDSNKDGENDLGDSPDSSRERSVEKPSKRHKKSKKSKKKRRRSCSSSSSSSSKSHRGGGSPPKDPAPKDEGFDKTRLGQRDFGGATERGEPSGGFQFRIRGRSWNRGGNHHGNSTNCNFMNMQMNSKNEDWDPEYTPKSKKYYLHDDRNGEGESQWAENRGRGRGTFARGRGRFIIRRNNLVPGNNINPKCPQNKHQVSGQQQEPKENQKWQDHNDGERRCEQ